MKKVKKKDNS